MFKFVPANAEAVISVFSDMTVSYIGEIPEPKHLVEEAIYHVVNSSLLHDELIINKSYGSAQLLITMEKDICYCRRSSFRF